MFFLIVFSLFFLSFDKSIYVSILGKPGHLGSRSIYKFPIVMTLYLRAGPIDQFRRQILRYPKPQADPPLDP